MKIFFLEGTSQFMCERRLQTTSVMFILREKILVYKENIWKNIVEVL